MMLLLSVLTGLCCLLLLGVVWLLLMVDKVSTRVYFLRQDEQRHYDTTQRDIAAIHNGMHRYLLGDINHLTPEERQNLENLRAKGYRF